MGHLGYCLRYVLDFLALLTGIRGPLTVQFAFPKIAVDVPWNASCTWVSWTGAKLKRTGDKLPP